MEEIIISITDINKRYDEKVIFRNFNINLYSNKINTIVGKSGCGKSTLLNIVSGILENDTSKIDSLKNLGISYIFQDDRLIDWLTVEENIKLVCNKKYNKKELDDVCDRYLNIVGLKEFKKYYPQMLSGGLRQRVNIARGLMYPSKVIVMDEPFKSIDIKNKQIIMEKLKLIQSNEERTIIFVTHDIEEALFLSDKIFVLGGAPVTIKGVINNSSYLKKEDIYKLI